VQALIGFLALGVVLGFARGGSVRALAGIRLGWVWLLYAALVMQVAANLPGSDTLGFVLVLASFVAVAAFAVTNLVTVGMPIIALGAALNALVIAVNQGMPVSVDAIAAVGEDPTTLVLRGKHFVDVGQADLRFLSDIIAWRLRPAVVSIGDLILWGGISLLIQDAMHGRVPVAPARADLPR
jgi:hypothetical protein